MLWVDAGMFIAFGVIMYWKCCVSFTYEYLRGKSMSSVASQEGDEYVVGFLGQLYKFS